MKDPLVPLLQRIVADRAASTRSELAAFCGTVLSARLSRRNTDLTPEDLEIVVLLVLLQGDEVVDVVTAAKEVS